MSIKSKDLSFNKQEPAFLRRMREANSNGPQDGRHERPVARPQRLRNPHDDEDDAPTYVDEQGGTVSKAEYDALVLKEQGPNDDPAEDVGGNVKGELQGTEPSASGAIVRDETAGGNKKQQVVEVGRPNKKRKMAKVVGAEDDDGAAAAAAAVTAATSGADGIDGDAKDGREKVTVKKAKKKGKPIKLSFGDDEE